jgi:hypothetical protein
MQKSRYGNTDLEHEYLIYPFKSPIKYDHNYTGTYSKYSLVDKYYVDTLVKPHKRLISGGAEWSLTGNGMTFSLSNIVYTFTGEILTFSASTPGLTFSNGDSSDRIDVVVINEDKTISIVKGDPNVTPTKPVISDSQIPIQYAYINASATTIGSSEAVYINGSQWQTQIYQLSGSLSGSVDFNSSLDDYSSLTCTDINTDYKTGTKFTKPIGEINSSQYGSLTMRIKLLSVVPEYKSLFLQIQGTSSGSAVNGNTLNLMTYGLDRDSINTWQHIVVPTSKFGSDVANIKSMTLRMAGGADGENTNWRIDYIFFQKGYAFDGYMGEPDSNGSKSGGSSTAGVIGVAEDGTYTDGVFTDFVPTTPIGTAIDRFNELFLALVPAKAPDLSDWSGSRTGGVNGKLSFSTLFPISGYTPADTAPTNPIIIDGTWTSSGKRLSIYASSSTVDISGVLNSQAAASATVPTPAYVALSFTDADLGTLTLNVNGTIVSTASLTTLTAINNTSGNTISGFVLSAATASKFPIGTPFDQFKNRTGNWLLKYNDIRLRTGYNYVIAEHKFSTTTRTLTRYEFIIDHNTDNTTFSDNTITSFSLTGAKYLSGISYFTGGSLKYDLKIDNLYRNTYYSGGDAITFTDNSTTGNAGTNPILNTSAQYSLPPSVGDELKSIVFSSETSMGNGTGSNFTILTSGVRRLNDPIGLYTTAKRTLQGTKQGGTSSITNVYLDNVIATSTNTFEGFDDEVKRLKIGTYDLITDVSSGIWDSTQSLTTGNPFHDTGLQVFNGNLIYPVTNFSTPGSSVTNNNFGVGGTNYSSATGERSYYRYFYQASPSTANFKINIAGSGGTFVAAATSITGNQIKVEFKLPGSGTPTTGWLDAYNDFATNNWADGNGGRKGTLPGRAFSTDWGLTVGTKNTSTSGGYVIVRITVAQGSAAIFTGLTFTFM